VRRSPNKQDVLKSIGLESGNNQPLGFSGQSAVLAAVPSGWFYLEKVNYNARSRITCCRRLMCRVTASSPTSATGPQPQFKELDGNPWPARVLRISSSAA